MIFCGRASSSRLAVAEPRASARVAALRPDAVGLHYLLIHFDIPQVDAERPGGSRSAASPRPALALARRVKSSDRRAASTARVRRQGRARLAPPLQPARALSLASAGDSGRARRSRRSSRKPARGHAVEVLFTGLDRGIQGEVEHAYERSLPLDEALRPDLLLAYEIERPAAPAAARLPAPPDRPRLVRHDPREVARADHRSHRAVRGLPAGKQYRTKQSEDDRDPDEDAAALAPLPPGIPDFPDRSVPEFRRAMSARPRLVGRGPVTRVEVSVERRERADATLTSRPEKFGWRRDLGRDAVDGDTSSAHGIDAAGRPATDGEMELRRLREQRRAARRRLFARPRRKIRSGSLLALRSRGWPAVARTRPARSTARLAARAAPGLR